MLQFGKTPKRKQSFGKAPEGVYKFKIAREVLAPTARPLRAASLILAKKQPVSGPFYVQGRRASDLEDRAYKALLKLGWTDREIRFQVDFLGGRQPGGQVLDFVVWSFSGPVVIPVNGDYWHARTLQVRQVNDQKAAYVKARFPQARYEPLYTADLLDDEVALRTLLRVVGRH